ncbi:MAG: hypothetical protein GQ564_22050 [Bacteroidales bacterium]|nr:hypothetical protein [Bacteroidales bacterium]
MQDGKTILIVIVAFMFLYISFKGCDDDEKKYQQSNTQQQKAQYEKSPVDVLIRNLSNEQNFSIILFDMDYSEGTDDYTHQYNVLVEREDSVYVQKTDWITVSNIFFDSNIDNMGMELASKKDGVVNKAASPAGYTNYVGNDKYGQWKERDGNRFWEYYGKYAFMSSMFRMTMFPVRYSYWNNYHSNYYGHGRSYYGPSANGRNMYGTNSSYTQANNSSKWNGKSNNFKSSVRSNVSRSATASKSRASRSNAAKRNRSSSRYSSSSTRSRGGSYGK